jgi:transposase
MIMSGAEVRVLVATRPVDFRRQANGLAALVQEALHEDAYSSAIFVFRSKRVTNRVKLLWWDGTGICLLTKRLENGQFCWPAIADGTMPLTRAQLSLLLEGLEWRHMRPREIVRPSATQ